MNILLHIEGVYQEVFELAEQLVIQETIHHCNWSKDAKSDFRRYLLKIVTQSSLVTVVTKTKLIDYALKTSRDGAPIDFRSDAYILQKILSRIADFTSYTIEVIKKIYQFLQLEKDKFILLNFIAESADSHNYARVPIRLSICINSIIQQYFYKPVDTSLYNFYTEFVASFFTSYNIITPQIYYSDNTCGIIELLSHHSQDKDADVIPTYFYYHLGFQLAILYALRATDMHMENIMACKNQPIILDLETICYRLEPQITWDIQYVGLVSDSKTSALLGGGNHRFIEFDVIFQNDEPTKPSIKTYKEQSWVQNRLVLSGDIVNPLAYFDNIIAGFKEGFQYILHQKKYIIEWMTEKFTHEQYQIRHLIRPTYIYSKELQKLDSPSSESYRKRKGELLYRFYNLPHLSHALHKSIVAAEITDLLYGDVPYFYSHSYNCHLIHHGRIVYPNYFNSTLHDMMRLHILSNITTNSLLQQLNTLQNIYDNLKQEV
jgi:lantibiotic modifying enzyme